MSEQEKTGTERTPAERQVQLYRDTVLELQARVRELEAIETAYKLTLEQCAHEQEENARLRKVVDAARRVSTIDKRLRPGAIFRMEEALRELDGEKYKCRHLISDQVGVTSVCRSCGEMC